MSVSKLQRHIVSAIAAVLISAVFVGAAVAPTDAIAASPINHGVVYA